MCVGVGIQVSKGPISGKLTGWMFRVNPRTRKEDGVTLYTREAAEEFYHSCQGGERFEVYTLFQTVNGHTEIQKEFISGIPNQDAVKVECPRCRTEYWTLNQEATSLCLLCRPINKIFPEFC